MVRARQSGREPAGGRACRKPGFFVFKDHVGNPVTTIYSSDGPKNYVSRLSLHLYSLSPLKEPAQELCELFLQLDGITRWGSARNYWPRVDIYGHPLNSLEECMQHHRLEKEFRKANGGLHIVPNWSKRKSYQDRPYRNVIFVIDKDCGDWQTVLNKGLSSVQYDLDSRPEDQFEVLEAEDLEDPRDEGLVEWNPVLDDPLIERVIISREMEDELARERMANWAKGNFSARGPSTLYEIWSDMTMALYDCTYRKPLCDGCVDDFEHTDCVIEQDRHYLNDNGDCVAGSEFKGPWPDEDSGENVDEEPVEECAGALVIDQPPANQLIKPLRLAVPAPSQTATGHP